MSPRRKAALLVAYLAVLGGCTPTVWAHKKSVELGSAAGRLYVPKLWEPLLPGSIYPDKRRPPLDAIGRPFVVVVCPPRGSCPAKALAQPLGERGAVVFVLKRLSRDPEGGARALREAADRLRESPECRGAPHAYLLMTPSERLTAALRRESPTPPVAVLGFSPRGSAAVAARGPAAVFTLVGESSPSPETSQVFAKVLGTPPVERWYAPVKGGFPPQVFRDAGEWLAAELGLR